MKAWYDLKSYGSCVQAVRADLVQLRTRVSTNSSRQQPCTMESNTQSGCCGRQNVTLPNNYYAALVQLKSLERGLELKSNYIKTVHDDIRKGYVIAVGAFNPDCRNLRDRYLPHHPVVNPNKPGKVRRVLNGASKFHGTSLIVAC